MKLSGILLHSAMESFRDCRIALFMKCPAVLVSLAFTTFASWAFTPPQPLSLANGSTIEFTENEVKRVQSGRSIWSAEASRPSLPLAFSGGRGEERVIFYEVILEAAGKPLHSRFTALNVSNGKIVWVHDFWGQELEPGGADAPIQAVEFNGKIWYGRGAWLEALDPLTGIVSGRHWAVEKIEKLSLGPGSDLVLDLQLGQSPPYLPWRASFANGAPIGCPRAPSHLGVALKMLKWAGEIAPDFPGTGRPDKFSGYLDLHRFKTAPVPLELRAEFEDFDLKSAEARYRDAFAQDPLNPYIALFLAFCLHYQGYSPESETWFAKALELSPISWHEALWMGAECEKLGFTQWADRFYDKGKRAYFAALPAPGAYPSLFEVLVHFPSQRAAATLFYNGHVDRAMDIVRLRREIFPFTEGDRVYHSRTLAWLQERGDEERLSEEKRWGAWAQQEGAFDTWAIPWWLQGWVGMLLASWTLFIILLCRAFLDMSNVLPFLVVLSGGVYLCSLAESAESLELDRAALLLAASCLLFAIPWLNVRLVSRKGGKREGGSRGMFALLSQSPAFYTALLCAAPAWTTVLSGSAYAATLATLASLPLLIAYRGWGRSALARSGYAVRAVPGRHVFCLCFSYLVVWAVTSLIVFRVAMIVALVSMPLPWADMSHPLWLDMLSRADAKLAVRPRDFRFSLALAKHLGGEVGEASREYQALAGDAGALNNLGVILFQESPDRARAYFKEALFLDPDLPSALYNIGILDGDADLISKARVRDPWRVGIHEAYKQGQPMIASVSYNRMAKSLVWDSGTLNALINPIHGVKAIFGQV